MHERSKLAEYLVGLGCDAAGDVIRAPAAGVTKEVIGEEHALVVTISTPTADRHGDVMRAEGARLERYRRNPVVMYNHDYDGLPVGKSLWEKAGPEGITAKPSFHLQTELSKEVWALLQKRILNAWSIGFLPEDWGPLEGEEGEEAKGFEVRTWDLLEYSCVPVPANFEALTHALKQARITAPALVKSLAPLGLRAPDLVPTQSRPERVPAGNTGKESDMEPSEVTLEWLESNTPELVGKLKSQGAEEEAAKAEKEKAESEQSAQASIEEKLAQARKDGAAAELARLKALKGAFPERAEFALEQFEAGATLEQAKDAFRDLRLAELEKENAKLKTAFPGAEDVGFDGDPDEKSHLQRAKDYQAEHGGPEQCSITEALKATAPKRR